MYVAESTGVRARLGTDDFRFFTQGVVRTVVAAARKHGFITFHVGDDPSSYGVDADTCKQHGGTLTTWLACIRACPSADCTGAE